MPSKKLKSIGVFDSGFGGVSILRSIVKELPQYNYIYLGDTARTPYGTRSEEVIYEFTRQAVDFLFAQNCELIILACNTASSEALRRIQQHYIPKHHPGKTVLGVLIPAAEAALAKTQNKRVGVMATASTVRSQAFVRELTKVDSTIKVFQQACPLLVPLVESGEYRSPAAKLIIAKYLQPLQKKNIDTLILGCTHYGILESLIRTILGPGISIISEAKVVPGKLREYLTRHPEVAGRLSHQASVTFYSTDLTDTFSRLGSQYFGQKIQAKKVTFSNSLNSHIF
jgi:glutamate racemase